MKLKYLMIMLFGLMACSKDSDDNTTPTPTPTPAPPEYFIQVIRKTHGQPIIYKTDVVYQYNCTGPVQPPNKCLGGMVHPMPKTAITKVGKSVQLFGYPVNHSDTVILNIFHYNTVVATDTLTEAGSITYNF